MPVRRAPSALQTAQNQGVFQLAHGGEFGEWGEEPQGRPVLLTAEEDQDRLSQPFTCMSGGQTLNRAEGDVGIASTAISHAPGVS